MATIQKITPFLWFDHQAEEAMNFYISVFKNSKCLKITRNGEGPAGAHGSVLAVSFQLDGQQFSAINGGPLFAFTPAISFVVNCISQAEVDEMWEKLSEGGQTLQCGWLKDKFGVSWQIVPTLLVELLQDADSAKAQRVMKALMGMTKIEIDALRWAYQQG